MFTFAKINFMKKFLLSCSFFIILTAADAQINCSKFCVTAISIDTLNNTLKVTIYNGDTNQVNYPIVQVLNNAGDTVGNKSGQYFLFAQLANTTVVHTIPTTLDSLPAGFTGSVYLKDGSSMSLCGFTYPMTCTVNVEELYSMNNVHIFPNPASDNINIAIDHLNNKNAIVTIYDALGNSVRSYTVSGGLLNISREGLQSGMYFISVDTDNLHFSNKLIID